MEQAFDPSGMLSRTRSYAYDAVNRLSQTVGAQGQTTVYAYDPQGNLTAVTDPLNHSTNYDYDALNRLAHGIDPKPEDRVIFRPKIRRMTSNNSGVYYILHINDISKESVKNIFEIIESFHFIAVLTRWTRDIHINHVSNIISDHDIEAIVLGIVEILVGAYDQEGLVLWQRDHNVKVPEVAP